MSTKVVALKQFCLKAIQKNLREKTSMTSFFSQFNETFQDSHLKIKAVKVALICSFHLYMFSGITCLL